MSKYLFVYAAGILTAAAIVWLLSRRTSQGRYADDNWVRTKWDGKAWTSADGTVSVSWAGVAG